VDLALECSTEILEWIQPFADFDWILTKEYKENEAYREYYKQSTNFKYVDNSVNEELEPCSLEDIKEVFDDCGGNLVVAPDWLGNNVQTLEGYMDAVKLFGKERVVGVLQGKTYEEILGCLNFYGNLVAVPYDIMSVRTDPPWLMGMRRNLVVAKIPQQYKVHLLGFTSLEELEYYRSMPNVISIDTGIPVKLGLEELDIMDPLESKATPTYKQMEEIPVNQERLTAIYRNLAILRKYTH